MLGVDKPRPSAALPELPGITLGRKLASGASASVYLAQQDNPRRDVAVKLVPLKDNLDDSFLKRLQQEGDFAAQFNHPNLVTVYSCGVDDGYYYLIMEYLRGGTLAGKIRHGLDEQDIIRIARAIASGLGYVHERGAIHRDVKPANILFDDQGNAVLVDFGIAKQLQTDSTLTQLGVRSGTPQYMSPEQTQRHVLDGRSDLYSLGIVLYEMLTGQAPFVSEDELAVAYGHVHEEVKPLPAAKARFQPVIDRLLAKRPENRYVNASELIKDLDALDAGRNPDRSGGVDPLLQPSWWLELSERRVIRTAIIYVMIAWAVTEIATTVLDGLGFPQWTVTAVLVLFVLGFPVAIVLSWVFDIGPKGVRRVRPSSRGGALTILTAVSVLISSTALLVIYLDRGKQQSLVDSSNTDPSVPGKSPRVAVLPFSDMSSDNGRSFLGDGVAEELLNQISSHPGIRNIGRSSSFRLARAGAEVDQFLSRFGVSHVIEGSVREAADNYTISVRLIDTSSAEQLWFAEYREAKDDLFRIQVQLARELLAELLGESEVDEVVARTGTRDVAAYRAYLRGRFVAARGNFEGSREWFKEAVELDPGYALAYVGLARGYYMPMFLEELREDPFMEIALNMAKRAVLLEPDLLEAHAALAMVHGLQYRWEDARASLDRAIALAGPSPANPDIGMVANMLGHSDLAAQVTQRRYETDPASPMALNGMVTMSYKVGKLDDALRYAAMLKEMGMVPQSKEAFARLELGDVDGAVDSLTASMNFWRRMLERSSNSAPVDFDAAEYARVVVSAITNPDTRGQAIEFIDRAMQVGGIPDTVALWEFSTIGAADRAYELAEELWEEKRFNHLALWQRTASAVRADPRFLATMTQIGLMDYWRRHGPPDFCRWKELDCNDFL